MSLDRRTFLRDAVGASLLPLAGCAVHGLSAAGCPEPAADFKCVDGFERTVLRTGAESGPAVILLHEMPGMSPDDMALARRLAKEGFNVYLPLLFGAPGQDSPFFGYFQSCFWGKFECSEPSTRSPILDWLEAVCTRVSDASKGPAGIIGMSLTGIFPLALLSANVEAAVLCQPTLPYNWLLGRPIGKQRTDIGLNASDLDAAMKSSVPLLTMRYVDDKQCPEARLRKLRDIFQQRLAYIELEGSGHSTLAGSFNEDAFSDAIQYLKVRLRLESGPKPMRRARLNGKKCRLTAEDQWREL